MLFLKVSCIIELYVAVVFFDFVTKVQLSYQTKEFSKSHYACFIEQLKAIKEFALLPKDLNCLEVLMQQKEIPKFQPYVATALPKYNYNTSIEKSKIFCQNTKQKKLHIVFSWSLLWRSSQRKSKIKKKSIQN